MSAGRGVVWTEERSDEGRRRTTGARSERLAQSPVTPSIASRIRSAWPLWRAYSSIMCT